MTPETRYEFDSIDVKQMLDSPELPEMIAALLELYRAKCQSEERQEETIRSLLDRIYGRKSEKSKYHPEQMLLLPELLEELADAAELESRDNDGDNENGVEADETPLGRHVDLVAASALDCLEAYLY